jgi:hypothetical protein
MPRPGGDLLRKVLLSAALNPALRSLSCIQLKAPAKPVKERFRLRANDLGQARRGKRPQFRRARSPASPAPFA